MGDECSTTAVPPVPMPSGRAVKHDDGTGRVVPAPMPSDGGTSPVPLPSMAGRKPDAVMEHSDDGDRVAPPAPMPSGRAVKDEGAGRSVPPVPLPSGRDTLPLPETTDADADAGSGSGHGGGRGSSHRRRLIIVLGVLLAVAMIAGVVWWRVDVARRVDAARSACESSLREARRMVGEWDTVRSSGETKSALRITVAQVADATTVTALAADVKTNPGVPVACDAADVSGLVAARDANDRLAEDAGRRVRSVQAGVRAVAASRDAKQLADAKTRLNSKVSEARKLLASSKNRVADDKTRTMLSDAINAAGKANDATAVEKAVNGLDAASKRVNESVAAKSKAAKAKADAEAAKRAAAQTQPTTPQYSTPQYSTPQYTTPQQSAPQQSTPQYTTPQQSTPQYGELGYSDGTPIQGENKVDIIPPDVAG
ncbi:hypothetical protein [Bifidobacterium jacchi]|uniref:Colicin transporter n=1 Tax=Bifidobacterium jacchi TaxID=2490545 RepID=A0A5N5REM7_9BIFI|nr:hypothetical protein [Bifidobacterium jacchi]KAB5605360.1 hypothetical protein EHS19_09445 [Bifidobacterium jacchi]